MTGTEPAGTGPTGPKFGPKIVTGRFGQDQSWTLQSYLADNGYEGLRKALSITPEEIRQSTLAASILGRGGAGFDAGRKWSMLRKAQPVYLVVNGDESEPATFKDHALMEGDPHQLIEGVVICAYAIGAAQAFIFVRGEMALAQERVQAALNEAYEYGAVGAKILGSDFSVDIVVHPSAGAYIAGDETGLLESLEGKRAFPRIKPPNYPAAMGLYGAPTVVNNVETLSNLAWIMRNGSDAFHALGEGPSRGTKVLSLSGHVRRPGNYEVEFAKLTFRQLIYDPELGGGVRYDRQLKAFIPGGASSPWFGPQHLDVFMGNEKIAEAGSMAGSGVHNGYGRDDVPCTSRVADNPFLPPGILRAVHALSRGVGLARENHEAHRRRGRTRSRPGPPHGRVRQHLPRGAVAARANDNLPSGAVDPEPDRLRDKDVPGRVPRPHPLRPMPVPPRPSGDKPRLCLTGHFQATRPRRRRGRTAHPRLPRSRTVSRSRSTAGRWWLKRASCS